MISLHINHLLLPYFFLHYCVVTLSGSANMKPIANSNSNLKMMSLKNYNWKMMMSIFSTVALSAFFYFVMEILLMAGRITWRTGSPSTSVFFEFGTFPFPEWVQSSPMTEFATKPALITRLRAAIAFRFASFLDSNCFAIKFCFIFVCNSLVSFILWLEILSGMRCTIKA